MPRWTSWLLAAVLVLPLPVVAGEVGVPYYRNYAPRDFDEAIGHQSWAAVQDRRGVLYVGNTSGVLEHDGVSWRLISLVPRGTARSLAVSVDGRVWVGGQGSFGVLEPDVTGRMVFRNLTEAVPAADRLFADVWKTHVIGDAVFFQTFTAIYRWVDGSVRVIRPDTSFHMSFAIDETLYVRQQGVGLQRLEGETLVTVPGGEIFADERVYAMVPRSEGEILVGTRGQGLFLMTADGISVFPTEADDYLADGQLYDGTVLADGSVALATLRGGAVLLDPDGRLLHILDRSMGIQDSSVFAVATDDRGGLWMTLDRNLARVQIPAAFTLFSGVTGLDGAVQSVIRHRGSLVAATTLGIYRLTAPEDLDDRLGTVSHFRPIRGVATQSWQLATVDGDLLAATNDGIYAIDGMDAIAIGGSSVLSLAQSKLRPDRIYAGLLDGLQILEKRSGGWTLSSEVPGIDDDIRTIAEDDDGTLWLGGRYRGVVRATPGAVSDDEWRVEAYGTDRGVPVGSGRLFVTRVGERILLATNRGLFRLDRDADRFVHDAAFGIDFADGNSFITKLREDAAGNVWMVSGPETGVGVARRNPSGSYAWESEPFRRIRARGVWEIYPEAGGQIWFGTSNGLIRFDPSVHSEERRDPSCLIRGVRVLPGGRALFRGGSARPDPGTVLDFDANSLRFSFAAPVLGSQEEVEYQHRLVGFDQDWSQWSREVKREYTNLPEGRYRFQARARLGSDAVGPKAEYEFEIRPPWQRTWWAYLLFGGLTLVFLFGFVQLQVARVRRKERIEAEHRRRAIELDRARQIQDHMLPTSPPSLAHFDIAAVQHTATEVGGDYYDFFPQPDGHLYVVVGDATGHGLGAGLMVTATRTALLTIHDEGDLSVIAEKVNRVLRRVHLGARLNMAMTMVRLALPTADGSVDVSASGGGMAPIYLLRNDGRVEEQLVPGVPLGALPDPTYDLHHLRLERDDVLIMMSDGLHERSHPSRGRLDFDGALRVLSEIGARYSVDPPGMTAEEIMIELVTASDRWAGFTPIEDDVTVVVIRVLGGLETESADRGTFHI